MPTFEPSRQAPIQFPEGPDYQNRRPRRSSRQGSRRNQGAQRQNINNQNRPTRKRVRDRIEDACRVFRTKHQQEPITLSLGTVTALNLGQEISRETGQPVTIEHDGLYGNMKVRILQKEKHLLSVGIHLLVKG